MASPSPAQGSSESMPDVFWNPFAALSASQREQLAAFEAELLRFNRKINLISRDTEAAFAERHLLHCLALAFRTFPAGSVVVDWGTGGGLPAIPLAVVFPRVEVHAVDAVRKKTRVVEAVGRRLGLTNLHPWHGRAEDWPGRAHYSVSRATAPLLDLWRWHARVRMSLAGAPAEAWQPGLICLKGGDLSAEVEALRAAFPAVAVQTTPLAPLLGQPFFAGKAVIEVIER